MEDLDAGLHALARLDSTGQLGPPARFPPAETGGSKPQEWGPCPKRNEFPLEMGLGPPARCPWSHFFFGWEGSPTKIDYREKGTLIPTSLLEDLVSLWPTFGF